MPSPTRIHKRRFYGEDAHTYYPVLIIGAGESGVAMGCRLKEALGFDQFRIFERQSGIGGTWWINRYPGAACDIPAMLYSFSFSPKTDWSTLHPPGAELAQYFADVCEKYQIVDKIQFHTDVQHLRWLEDEEEWEVTLSYLAPGTGDLSSYEREQLAAKEGAHRVYIKTEVVRAKIVVSGVGGLVEPKIWPANVDLRDKDVVVIGSGCSSAQVVPEIAKPEAHVRSVTQLMRTPPWVQPDLLPPTYLRWYEKWMPTLLTRVPGLGRLFRAYIFWRAEHGFLTMFADTAYSRRKKPGIEKRFLENMRKHAPKEYHEMLTPNYPLGCKRRVVDNAWYKSLNAPHVELSTQPLTQVHPRSVTIGPGHLYPKNADSPEREIPADVIILGNGFETNQWLHPLKVTGRGNKDINEVWEERGGAQAYLGIAMDHFPNFFMLFGPNTGTGHTSVIFATENAVEFSLRFIKPILEGHVSAYEVKEEAEISWTKQIQNQLQKTVFRRGGCSSWYITADGWNSSTYPYSQLHYWYRCAFPVWGDWSAKLTRKGVSHQRVSRVLRLLVLGSFLFGVQWLRKKPQYALQVVQLLGSWKEQLFSRLRFF
ncbi:hypothetical protein N7470_002954 [Penicillium chermesinum]|nr:hypothetical protein N7470_002954 [Penicillium chermesinum]